MHYAQPENCWTGSHRVVLALAMCAFSRSEPRAAKEPDGVGAADAARKQSRTDVMTW